MGKSDHRRCVFPLTSLQIGDLQSYLSDLSLFLAPESKKFYILVDNRPWLQDLVLQDLVSRPAHLWQLMVTKSRLSPFANTRGQKGKKDMRDPSELKASSKLTISRSQKLKRWFSVVEAATLSKKRALLPVKKLRSSLILNSKLHRTLYGFIVFEVAWTDVRGINYLNELQTDTSLAIETKCMRRWEFDSIVQAVRCMSSWFPGTPSERFLLEDHLNSAIGEVFYDASETFLKGSISDDDEGVSNVNVCEGESPCYLSNSLSMYPPTPPPEGPYKRRKLTNSMCTDAEADMCDEGTYSGSIGSPMQSQASYASDCEESTEATLYRDVLLLFRFDDGDLPFKLKGIIMSDLRLLTLLESGLPSWVLFLQSYPVFCHLYRPWMCPLARALYVVISLVTVLIGFYDLYKNVPVLKATASRLCGPLFDWIETWEMVSRIKYLGTMLFLHNFEKAVTWFLMVTRTTRSFLSVLTQPLSGPFVELLELLLPIWNVSIQLVEGFCSFAWVLIEGFWNIVDNLVEIIIQPVWFIITLIWSIAASIVYPIFWLLSEILYAPIRLVLGICALVAFICTCIYELIGGVWLSISSLVQFASNAETAVSTYEVSLWRSLWNDLFSQIFRAVRSILHGFVAFFTACNRHRLSIYNHVSEFIRRLRRPAHRLKVRNSNQEEQASGTQTLSEGRDENPFQIKGRKLKYM